MRKVAPFAYRVADLFPNGFQIAVNMRMMCFTDMRGLSDMQRLVRVETVAMMSL